MLFEIVNVPVDLPPMTGSLSSTKECVVALAPSKVTRGRVVAEAVATMKAARNTNMFIFCLVFFLRFLVLGWTEI